MVEPQPSPLRPLEDMVSKGLNLFNSGVDQISNALSTADTSVRKVDGSLTGAVGGSPPASSPPILQDGQVAGQVAALARQGQQAAQETGLQSPRAAASFQELVRLIFNPSMARTDALQDLLPSPAQTLQTGMRDLRGSVSLVRLANGTGTPDDLVSVVGFAESLMGRVGVLSPLAEPAAVASSPAPPVPAPAEAPAGEKKPRKKRGPRKKKEPDPQTVALAKAVALEIGDAELTQAAADFGEGKLTEAKFQKKMGAVAEEKGVDLDLMLNQATEKMDVPS